ncbi:hypothetical protein HKX48_000617, partial [Thoreauomyces humboldtii]
LKRAREFGFHAEVYGNKEDFKAVTQDDVAYKLSRTNDIDVLFVTADMMLHSIDNQANSALMRVPQFKLGYRANRRGAWQRVPLVVIDEIHTIAEATDGFFTSWLNLWRRLDQFHWYSNARKVGLTATLDDDERKAVNAFIPGAKDWNLVPGGRLRGNIALRVVPGRHSDATIEAWLQDYIAENPDESIVVFVNRKVLCRKYVDLLEKVPEEKRGQGQIELYHASLDKKKRQAVEDRFRSGQTRVLVATKAIGLGFDKPDLRTVIHTFTPATPTEYYQQIGRAGRDEQPARAWLLPSVPFNTHSTENALILAARYLYRCPNRTACPEDVIAAVDGLSQGQIADATTIAAIEHAVCLNIFRQDAEEQVTYSNDTTAIERFEALRDGVTSNANKLAFMKSLNRHGGPCVWKELLHKLGDPTIPNDFVCNRCTGTRCDPPDSDDLPSDPFAGRRYCSRRLTAKGLTVYGLHKPQVDFDMGPDRLRIFAAAFMPGYQELPARWCVSYIPDGEARVREAASDLALALQLELVDFVTLDPAVGESMMDAKTDEDRQNALCKYRFDKAKLPPPGTKVLLYDDVMKTGTTLDHVADVLHEHGNPVVGLAQTVYPWAATQRLVNDEVDMIEESTPSPER